MAITRRGESSLALQLELLNSIGTPERRQEFRWLLGASLLVAGGLALVLIAKTQDFGGVQSRLASGELLDLNAPHEPGDFAALLSNAFSDPRDRELAAGRLAGLLERHKPLPNVGALARLRVSKAELEEASFAAWRRKVPVSGKAPASLPLLPLAKLKPFLVVRTPGEFLPIYALWVLSYLAAFWIVHLVWRWRKFRGDPAILPAVLLLTGMGLILMISLRDPLRDTLEFRKFAWGAIAGCAILLLPLFKGFQYRNFARFTYSASPLSPDFVRRALTVWVRPDRKRCASQPRAVSAGGNHQRSCWYFFWPAISRERWEWLRELRKKASVPRWLRWLELPRVHHVLPVMCAVACALLLFFVLKDMGPALVTGLLFLIVFAIARRRSGLAVLGSRATGGRRRRRLPFRSSAYRC